MTEEKKPHLSASQVSTWMKCPRMWAYRYIEGIKTPPAWAMLGGTAVDKALTANNNEKMKAGPLPVDVMTDIARQTIYDEAMANPPIGDGSLPDVTKRATAVIPTYMQKMDHLVEPVAAQKPIEVTIGGRTFKGIIDLVRTVPGTPSLVTSDYKFNARQPSPDVAQRSLQLRVYDRATADPAHQVDIISLVATSAQKPSTDVYVRTHFVKPHEQEELERIVRIVSWQMDQKVYPQVDPSGIGMDRVCSPTQCGYWRICRGNPSGKPQPIRGEVEV